MYSWTTLFWTPHKNLRDIMQIIVWRNSRKNFVKQKFHWNCGKIKQKITTFGQITYTTEWKVCHAIGRTNRDKTIPFCIITIKTQQFMKTNLTVSYRKLVHLVRCHASLSFHCHKQNNAWQSHNCTKCQFFCGGVRLRPIWCISFHQKFI